MKLSLLMSTLAVAVLAWPAGADERPPAPPRELSKADTEWVTNKYDDAVKFGRAGKWGPDEAQGPVREIVERCTRELGAAHYFTRRYVREIEGLKRLAALPEAGRAEYRTCYTLADTVKDLRDKERYADAVRPAGQLLDIHRRLLGPDHAWVAMTANQYGQVLHHAGRYDEADKQFAEALRIYIAVLGETDPVLAEVYGYRALSLEKLGRDKESKTLFEKSLALYTRLLGESNPWTGMAMNNLAGHFDRQALYREAEKLYRTSVAVFIAYGPDANVLLATGYGNLALNLSHQARYAEADDLFKKALEIRQSIKKQNPADMGRLYMNRASNLEALGRVVAAESLLRKALDAYREGYGRDHVETAWTLNSLGLNLNRQARYADGEGYVRDALEILHRAPGVQTLAIAKVTNNLASCLRDQGKLSQSRALSEKALALLRDRLDADHPDLAASVNNIAATLEDEGRYADAERHFRAALATLTRRLGADHPDTTLGRVNLGVNLHHQGRFDEADREFRTAVDAYRRVLGETHPSTAWAYKNLVDNACARGAYDSVEEIATVATACFEAARLRLGLAGLDRARRSVDYSPLPALAVAAARRGKPRVAFETLERDLARGLFDDLTARRLEDEDRKTERDLLETIELLDQRIEALRSRGPAAAADRRTAEAERDTAQGKLVEFQEGLSKKHGVPAGRVYDLDHIQRHLPDDAALLTWADLPAAAGAADPKGDHWACVVRRRGEPVWVQLAGNGPNSGWTDGDDRLGARARGAAKQRPDGKAGEWTDLAERLAAQRIAPVKRYLDATADLPAVRHLIVLPAPKMAGVPVDALPGVADRFTVSYAPSGTMFAWLRERRAAGRSRPDRLLALGDPAFRPSGDAGPSAAATGRREAFVRLPGTDVELSGVGRVFRTKRLLTGADASRRDLDDLAAAGRLGDYRYLHFATHGVLDDQRPMRSALILAQAPSADGSAAADGRLTAEQILRRWRLDADLVTLSACNTGVGKQYSGGEGYLGFSQALFLAGARSMVLSLWEVDDASTALLMARFYENLAGDESGKPPSKAEALAEAKKWLRTLDAAAVDQLTKDLPTRGTRGKVVPRQPAGPVQAARTYEHPYYWSGFVLIGDPE